MPLANEKNYRRSGTVDLPPGWEIVKQNLRYLVTPGLDVQEDHGGVEEGVFGIELRGEGAGLVPEGVVLKGDCSTASNAPGLFVEFLNGQRAGFVCGFDLRDVAREIANFV